MDRLKKSLEAMNRYFDTNSKEQVLNDYRKGESNTGPYVREFVKKLKPTKQDIYTNPLEGRLVVRKSSARKITFSGTEYSSVFEEDCFFAASSIKEAA